MKQIDICLLIDDVDMHILSIEVCGDNYTVKADNHRTHTHHTITGSFLDEGSILSLKEQTRQYIDQ